MIDIPDPVRLRAKAVGVLGEAWLAALPTLAADLAATWRLSLGRTLSGGTEALVVEALLPDGRAAVLKLAFPDADPSGAELRTLFAASGRGYAEVYAHDPSRHALLLERLGSPLADLGLPVEAQLAALCATLRDAWACPPDGASTSGAEKASGLAAFIAEQWESLGRPCAERSVEQALHFAEARRLAHDPERVVLAHGDPHPWNALLVLDAGPPRFKFVDPDGLFIEPGYDLGVLMREWTAELLAGDPLALGRARCERLAALTGVAPEPIWQWGVIERLSTGLHCLQLSLPDGRDMLAVSDAWSAQRDGGQRLRR